MSENTPTMEKATATPAEEVTSHPEDLSDGEAEAVVGGTGSSGGGGYTQQQYDQWEKQGTADRSDHGPGSGE